MSNHNLNYPKSDKEPGMVSCPVCNREFRNETIENHVNKCLFLNSQMEKTSKRDNSHLKENLFTAKRLKVEGIDTTSNSKVGLLQCLLNKIINYFEIKNIKMLPGHYK